MAVYPKLIEETMEFYKQLPGIGEKNAERLALATMLIDEDVIADFANSIVNLKTIHECLVCGHFNGLWRNQGCLGMVYE